MMIVVEFYGIARRRAGIEYTEVWCAAGLMPVGDVLAEIGRRFPEFARECLAGDRLQSGYLANVGGQRFVVEPHTLLADGEVLLIMSADAGG